MTASGRSRPLRDWQEAALSRYRAEGCPRDFLVTATPGAGKTTFALAVARELFDTGRVRRLIVVTPTDHLRTQWMNAAQDVGFDLRATPNRKRLPKDADGVVATYAQVAAAPEVFSARCKTTPAVVVFDELHHAGDQNSWGGGVAEAFEEARHRVGITGTPFRTDQSRIPHVRYEPVVDAEPGTVESVADVTYGYRDALREDVVRPVVFAAYSAATRWSSSAGAAREAMLGDLALSRRTEDEAWKAALNPDAAWIPHVFAAMDDRLNHLRGGPIPDAAALVLAANQGVARQYADVWEAVNGYRPALIVSDDPESSRTLSQFRDDPAARAAISVRMVSEGVDIPRAAVLGFATTASTPLFFAQAVGRVVRSRRRGEAATVFLPAVGRLVAMAAAMEEERNHVLPTPSSMDDLDLDVSDEEPPVHLDDEGGAAGVVEAEAAFHRAIPGAEPDDDMLPGLLTTEQEAELLEAADQKASQRALQVTQERARAQRRTEAEAAREHADRIRNAQWQGGLGDVVGKKHVAGTHISQAPDDVAQMRRLIADRVRAHARATGAPIEKVWGRLYRETPGPKNAEATKAQLQRRVETTNDW